MLRTALLVFLLVLPSTAIATTRVLANGMTVVLAPNVPGANVAIHATFDAGSRHDPTTEWGTAWTANRILGARLAGVYADVNQERALLTVETGADEVPAALQRLTRALGDRVAPGELPVPESRNTIDAPYAGAEPLILRLVYGARPHGHEPDVAPKTVRAADVAQFVARHYGASSAVVAIAGTFDEQAMLSAIESTLGTLPAGKPRHRCVPYDVKLRREARRHLQHPGAQQPDVSLGYPTAVSGTPDWYALNILADILGQGPRSRLQMRLVASSLATHLSEGETESPCTASLLRIRARVAAGVAAATVQAALDEELERLRQQLVTAEELDTARQQERQWAADQIATPAARAGALARLTLFYGHPEHKDAELAGILAVTAEDVRRVARRYLAPSRRAVVITTTTNR